ncbi:MAG: NAD(P)-dependent oxidoreductase [Dehalococcoidales bacterium]|nr:NAD(P)-dependent oxidoreductase [Dehalococcoidales bacterium]
MKIGFIGVGQMGRHMARNVMEAGYDLTIYDAVKEAAAPLLEKGAKWADTPKDMAQQCNVILSSLPTPQIVEEVVYGENGLLKGWKEGDIYVDMSTNSPSLMRKIAEDAAKKGVTVLDGPVSGGVRGAEAGSLTIMVGGNANALEKVNKALMAMGQKVVRVGDVGCGNAAKLVNNLISLAINSISAEGFVLGVKAGIDPQVLLDIISTSTGENWCAKQYPKTTFVGNFEPGFKISLAYKDIGLALGLGEEYGVPLPVGDAVKKDLEDTIAAGYVDKGVDAVILPLEKAAGVEVRTSK